VSTDGRDWIENEGRITKDYYFDDYKSALNFVNKIGELAESLGHHPDITFGWGYVHVSLYTHDVAKISNKDWKLAEAIDKIV
jgi:4a-hydroxytetrahydrobiopterin dehydratase